MVFFFLVPRKLVAQRILFCARVYSWVLAISCDHEHEKECAGKKPPTTVCNTRQAGERGQMQAGLGRKSDPPHKTNKHRLCTQPKQTQEQTHSPRARAHNKTKSKTAPTPDVNPTHPLQFNSHSHLVLNCLHLGFEIYCHLKHPPTTTHDRDRVHTNEERGTLHRDTLCLLQK